MWMDLTAPRKSRHRAAESSAWMPRAPAEREAHTIVLLNVKTFALRGAGQLP